jgi:hypothetical protein
MSKDTIRKITLVACCAVLVAGCGRNYSLIGRVVQSEPGLEAGIHEVESLQQLEVGQAITSGSVILYHEIDDDGRPVRDSDWQKKAQIKSDGTFEISDYAKSGAEATVGLEVSTPDGRTQFATYVDFYDPDEQYFLVVMPANGSEN